MSKYYLGIDLGTSSVKLLLTDFVNTEITVRKKYRGVGKSFWSSALASSVKELKKEFDIDRISAVSLSSQVGTYILDSGDVIGWQSGAGKEELAEIKSLVPDEEFISEIGMVHPDIISYPLPRLLYVKRKYGNVKSIIMPKEYLIKELTGNTVSDIFSYRGLCNPETGAYSKSLLQRFKVDLELPTVKKPTDLAGTVSLEAERKFGIKAGTPVYIGCNDFYAGLLGMGIYKEGSAFELSGTSEHLGVITKGLCANAVSGRYFNGYATYGGTKSSGTSCDFAIEKFGLKNVSEENVLNSCPIFLPYINGERAPIYDADARGVFFGIGPNTSKADMAYSVLEGVVFSLYHISRGLPFDSCDTVICGGGSAKDCLMSRLKAELFNKTFVAVAQNDTSALGAAMIGAIGNGYFSSYEDAVSTAKYADKTVPSGKSRELLLRRYAIYEKLYSDLKERFSEFADLKGILK